MINQKTRDLPQQREENGECRHHWKIESAVGPTSKGVCKFCGAEREFVNSLADLMVVKRHTNILELPELPEVGFDEEQNKS